MEDSNMIDLFSAMDILVIKQAQDRSFKLVGEAPAWFAYFHPSDLSDKTSFHPEKTFPFLEGFIEKYNTFWSAESNIIQNRKTGWWTEIDTHNKVHYFQSTALILEDDRYLIIEHATESSELFGFLQKYKETMLKVEDLFEKKAGRAKTAELGSDLSLADELTGLHNRRAFFLLVEQQHKMAKRHKLSTLMIMLDIVDLELITKKYGEKEGSVAAIATADILKRTFRKTDVIARFGADGFAILALEIENRGEKAIVARLKKNITRHNATSFKTYDIAVVTGIVKYNFTQTDTVEELIQKAGFQLNEKKRAGKTL